MDIGQYTVQKLTIDIAYYLWFSTNFVSLKFKPIVVRSHPYKCFGICNKISHGRCKMDIFVCHCEDSFVNKCFVIGINSCIGERLCFKFFLGSLIFFFQRVSMFIEFYSIKDPDEMFVLFK